MVLMNFAPVAFLFAPTSAQAVSEPDISQDLKLSYDKDSNWLHIYYPNDDRESDYNLTYSRDAGADGGVLGSLINRDGEPTYEEDNAYFGTESHGVYTPDHVTGGTVVLPDVVDNVKREFVIDHDLLWYKDTTSQEDDTFTIAKTFDVNRPTVFNSPLTLNQTIYYPNNNDLQVTFTRLPDPAGQITIREIYLTEEQKQTVNTDSDVAYEITSDMENGTFTYNLQLPIPTSESETHFTRYANNLDDLLNNQGVESEPGNQLTDMTHFTVFVVSNSATPTPTPTYTPTPAVTNTPTPTPTPVNPHLLVNYHFNSCNNTTAIDSGDYHNNASLVSMEKVGGYSGQGILVNDIHDSLVFNTPLSLGTEQTVSSFVNFAKADDGLTFETSYGVGYGVRYHSGELQYQIAGTGWVDSGYTPETNKWYHVAFTKADTVWSGVAASRLSFFVNGQKIREYTIPWMSLPELGAPITLYRIGNNSSLSGSGNFAARVDELTVWDHTLTDAEVLSWYQSYSHSPANCLATPTNLGFNIRSHSADPGERPVDISCGGATNGDYPHYYNGKVAHNWEATANPAGVKYHRQWQYPNSSTWAAGETNWTTDHTNYRTFGSNEGTEGNWNTRVRSWFDIDGDGQLNESIDDVSGWSNECHVVYDRTKPQTTITNPTGGALISGQFEVKGTASDSLSGIDTIRVRFRRMSNNHLVGTFWANYDETSQTWSVPINDGTNQVPDGKYKIIVRVLDKAGNVRWRSRKNITIDNTPPAKPTGLRRIAPNEGNKIYACGTFSKIQRMWPDWNDNTESDFDHYEYTSFNAPDGHIGLHRRVFYDSIFKYNGSWMPNEGTYGFAVRAVDKAGNASEWALSDETLAGSCQITYDNTAPTITFEQPASGSIHAGVVNLKATCNETCDYINFWWRKEGQSYSNTSPDRRYHYIFDDGTEFNWDLNTLDAERWGGDPSYVMEDGTYYLYAAGKDLTGNWSRTPEIQIIVDNTAPTLAIDGIKYSNGDVKDKFVTNWNTPKIVGTVDDANLDTVTLTVNGHDYTASVSGGTWEADISDALADGNHTMTIVATDVAGNSTTQTQDIFVDTVAPTAEHQFYKDNTLIDGFHTYYEDGKKFTGPVAYVNSLDRLNFTGIYQDTSPSAKLYWDSYAIFPAQADGSFAFNHNGDTPALCGWRHAPNLVDISAGSVLGAFNVFNLTTKEPFTNCTENIDDGEYYIAHQIYDQATRKDIPSINQFRDVLGLHFIVDTQNPTVSASVNPATADGENGWYVTRPTITLSASDDQALDRVEYHWDSDGWSTYTDPTQIPSEGEHTISYRAYDKAGNVSSEGSLTLKWDETQPTVSASVDPAFADGDNGWYVTQPTVTLTAGDNQEVDRIEYHWNSDAWNTYTSAVSVPTEGTHTIYYRSFDSAGNVSSEGSFALKWDQTQPDPAPADLSVSNLSGSTADLSWTAAGDNASGIDRYDVSWRLKSDPNAQAHGKTVSAGTTSTQIDSLADGEWEIKVKAIDAAGNWSETLALYTIGGGTVTPIPTTPTPTLTPTPAVLGAATEAGGIGGGQVLGTATLRGNQQAQAENNENAGEENTGNNQVEEGEVKGVSTSCASDWTNYLPIILLIVQALFILGMSLLFSWSIMTKHVVAGVATLATIILYYLLTKTGMACIPEGSWLAYLDRFFWLISAVEGLVLRLVGVKTIDE